MTNIDIQAIKEKFDSSNTIFVLFGQNATTDHVAAALGLYLVLKAAGKQVTVASPTELRTEFSRLVGLNQVTNQIGNRNLVISFTNYNFEHVDKVSVSDPASDHFELIIQPKNGHHSPDPKDIEYSFKGAQADLIFTIGVSRLEDLGELYEAERGLYSEATVVSFNRRQNPSYAAVSVVDTTASSLSEIVAEFVQELGLSFQDDTASNFLAGIDFATNRFQNPMISPSAFIMAGRLLQAGARRQPPRITSAAQIPGGFATQPSSFFPFRPPNQPSTPAAEPPPPPSESDTSQPKRPPLPQLQPVTPPQTQPNSNNQPRPQTAEAQDQPPQDWLEPKIFKGSTKV